MTFVIPEPCIDVKDKACIEECAAERICAGERMLSIRPGDCADRRRLRAGPRGRGDLLRRRCARPVDPAHRRERQIPRSARLARQRRQDRPAALRHRACRQLRRGAAAGGVLARQWRGGGANADPAADPPAEEATATTFMRAGPGPQAARLRSAVRASRPAGEQVTGVRYRLEVRLTPADVGQRVVIRWRRPSPGDGEQIADVLGILEENDSTSFAVRTADGALVVIPAARALAGKVVPPAPQNRRRAGPTPL